MSVVLRKRPPSSGGTPTEPSSSKKQRFIDAVKMLLDIAKESSDAFPPLKSCLGGINALIKHYDQYNDVKDKLNDLIPWLNKLQESLAKVNPDDNHEEVERRSQLAKSLEDIGKRSLALSEKGKVARVLDKTQDSQEVIKLVERLRQAILEYQVSQQQSIYNQVVQLTSSFDVLLKLHQKTPVKNKIESVRARLDRLGAEGDGTPRNAGEFRRRKRLFEALEGIKDKLQLLSECSGAAGSVENEGDAIAACDLADDLRDAIVEYQFAQQKAIYEQNCALIDAAELSVLNSCRRAGGVEFRHGDRQGCLKGTRDAVLDEIELWSKDHTMSPVYWLNGLAGTGKSTIAQTISERIFADGILGASFFCSRDFKDRRDLRIIFPTLAFQLAHKYPKFRSILVPLLQSNPDIVHESLYNQMEALIVRPLNLSDISTVIIIDALDECVDKDPQSAILSVMGRLVEEIPEVKFLITGRPEPRIQSGFRLELLRPLTDVFVLHDVEPSVVNTDIRLFLEHGLSELAKRRGIEQSGWPTDQQIDLLCKRAAGLFVYAVATLKFLDHPFTPPSKQLDIITKSPGSTTHEGSVEVRSSTTLDSLYISSFQGAFDGMNPDDDEKVRFVIGTVILAMNPLPPSAIATLVELEGREVMDLLRLIQSLLKLSEDPDSPVLPFHKSFPDFIIDPIRCPIERFHISPRVGHLKLALDCLKLMNGSLEQNYLLLPDYALNSEIEDLQTRKERISVALEYACKSWHSHLIEARGDVTAAIPTLRNFLQEGFLAWLEILSVIGAARDAVIALENLVLWLQEVVRDHQLLDTARDYFHFTTTFFEVIDVSATHIYHSALELSPLSSIVRRFYYYQRPRPSPRVVVGIPDSWDPSTAVSTKHSYYLSSVWSPCGQFVATAAMGAVEIRDAHTLEVLSTPRPTKMDTKFRHGLAYSPDGCSLAGCSDSAIMIWDTQTGGTVKTVECEVPVDGLDLVWSSDGTTLGAVSPRVSGTVTVYTHDVPSGTTRCPGTLQTINIPYLWVHDTSFRIATTTEWDDGWRVNVFQVGPALTKIESFPLRFHSSPGPFSPTTYRISVAVSIAVDRNRDAELFVLDLRSSELLLREPDRYRNPSFSPDGSFFAAFAGDRLVVWRYIPGRYTRWRDFRQTPASIQFSPTSSSILGRTGALLHVLHLDYSHSTRAIEPAAPARSIPRNAYSPHGSYIATTCRGERAITITDLRPQNPAPSQYIDTDFEISEIVLTGNVLLAKGSDTVVAWLLTEEGVVSGIFDNRRADRSDSLWDMSPGDATAGTRDRNPSFWGRLLQRDRGKRDGDGRLEFSVEDGIAAVGNLNGFDIRIYNAETGETLEPDKAPLHPGRTWYRFHNPHRDDCDVYHRNLRKSHEPLESDWPVSQTALREGWVRDSEGKHRLWLHARWRSAGNDVEWLDKVTTMRLKNSSELVIVKF